MKCPHCDATIMEGAAFCHVCGGELGDAAGARPAENGPELTARDRLTAKLASSGGDDDDAEQVLWQGRFSKLAMIGAWISAGVFSVAVVVAAVMLDFRQRGWIIGVLVIAAVWIILLLRLLYQQFSIRYMLTNQRLVHERGLLWRKIDRIEVIDVDDVTFSQGPVERMLGVGTVRVLASDQSTPKLELVGIEDVRQVATFIDEARRKERRKRGVHIESI